VLNAAYGLTRGSRGGAGARRVYFFLTISSGNQNVQSFQVFTVGDMFDLWINDNVFLSL